MNTKFWSLIETNMKRIRCYFSKTRKLRGENRVIWLAQELYRKSKSCKSSFRVKKLRKESLLMKAFEEWPKKMSLLMSSWETSKPRMSKVGLTLLILPKKHRRIKCWKSLLKLGKIKWSWWKNSEEGKTLKIITSSWWKGRESKLRPNAKIVCCQWICTLKLLIACTSITDQMLRGTLSHKKMKYSILASLLWYSWHLILLLM
jgi:hypothetical protein